MQLFSFGNLLKPENTETPRKINRDEPTFKELVKNAISNKDGTVEKKSPDTIQELTPGTKFELEKFQEIKPEALIVDTKKALEQNPKPEEQKTVSEKAPEDTKLEDVKKNETFGTYFLKSMLSEFSDVLAAGKDLNDYETSRTNIASEKETKKKEFAAQMEAKESLRTNLVNLLSKEENFANNLEETIKSYDGYLTAIESSYKASFDVMNQKEDAFIKKIQRKRIEINGLINKIGGHENFNKIKEVVTKCKELRQAALEKQKEDNPEINTTLAEAITNDVNTFVEGDLHGAVMLAEQGNIVGILMSVFATKK